MASLYLTRTPYTILMVSSYYPYLSYILSTHYLYPLLLSPIIYYPLLSLYSLLVFPEIIITHRIHSYLIIYSNHYIICTF